MIRLENNFYGQNFTVNFDLQKEDEKKLEEGRILTKSHKDETFLVLSLHGMAVGTLI